MSFDDEEVMREYLLESTDNLNPLDRDFVALEQYPRNPERLGLPLSEPSASLAPPREHTFCTESPVSGARQGIVTARVSENLARRVAGSIFESPSEAVGRLGHERLMSSLGGA